MARPSRPASTRSPVPGGRPPDLGEHTEEILAEEIGLGAEEIAALRREGVV